MPGLKTKNLQTPAKRRMKAFNESAENGSAVWSHPSLCGEVGRWSKGQPQGRPATSPGRAQLNRYPDFGFDLAPAFPAFRPVAWWELVARHSGATVPDSHGVPRHLAAKLDERTSRDFKERTSPDLRTTIGKAISFSGYFFRPATANQSPLTIGSCLRTGQRC